MKNYILIMLLGLCTSASAQSKKTVKALANSRLLVMTIFETKDSATLEKLFAPGMVHVVAGKTESRSEAIKNIAGNKSTYVQASMTNGYGTAVAGDTITVRYFYKGKENKTDGTSVPYTVNLVMQWLKEKKNILLHRLETIKIE